MNTGTVIIDLRADLYKEYKGKSLFILQKFVSKLRSIELGSIYAITDKESKAYFEKSNVAVDSYLTSDSVSNEYLNSSSVESIYIYFSPKQLWVDGKINLMIEEFRANECENYINTFQSGYQPLITNNNDVIEELVRIVKPVNLALAGKNNTYRTAESYKRFSRYILADELDSVNTLYRLYNRDLELTDLPIDASKSSFAVLNNRHMVKQIEKVSSLVNLNGKKVLEIGASPTNPIIAKLLTEEYGCDYTGVNIEKFSYSPADDKTKLIEEDIHNVQFQSKSFDIIFSIAAWEHIPDPLAIFDKVEFWLKNSGVHYGIFQAWSSRVGHHIFSPRFPASKVPDYSHLMYEKSEFTEQLKNNGCAEKVAQEVAEFAYDLKEINRVRLRDFVQKIRSGSLEIVLLDGRNNGKILPSTKEIAGNIEGYTAEELSCLGLEFLLRKSDFKLLDIVENSTQGETSNG